LITLQAVVASGFLLPPTSQLVSLINFGYVQLAT